MISLFFRMAGKDHGLMASNSPGKSATFVMVKNTFPMVKVRSSSSRIQIVYTYTYICIYILEASRVKLARFFLDADMKPCKNNELHPDESLPCGDEYRFYRVQRPFMVWICMNG